MNNRIESEKEFHNKSENMDLRKRFAGRFYSIDLAARIFYLKSIKTFRLQFPVLEYGCGPGSYALDMVADGFTVYGIDISDVTICEAASQINERNSEKLKFCVMNAEELEFPDNYFGGICGTGILHHLNLEKACEEISRTLVPDGAAIFLEPLGHNYAINLYRKLTPKLRTEDEHPLLAKDLELIKSKFKSVEFKYFYLTTILAVPFRKVPGWIYLVNALNMIDTLLFKMVPFLRKQAWIVVVKIRK